MSPCPLTHFVDYKNYSTSHRHFLASMTIEVEPTRFFYAVSNPKRRCAMKQKIDALEKNET